MAILILAAFIGVPLLEIAVFIEVGGLIGLWPTLGIVILTAVLGTWQLRAQGLATLMRARDQVDRGALPTRELFDGACLLVAGALLLTPGFVTDATGFLLFLPPFRDILRQYLARRLEGHMEMRTYGHGGPSSPGGPDGPVIDGEFEDTSAPEPRRDATKTPRNSGPGRPGTLPR